MKVLILANNIFSKGGKQEHAKNLINALKELDSTNNILCDTLGLPINSGYLII